MTQRSLKYNLQRSAPHPHLPETEQNEGRAGNDGRKPDQDQLRALIIRGPVVEERDGTCRHILKRGLASSSQELLLYIQYRGGLILNGKIDL